MPFLRRVLGRFRLGWADVAALRKSAVLALWLKKSWTAWVCTGLYAIFAGFLLPAAARPVLRIWHPPVRGRGAQFITSVINNTRVENPRVDEILASITPILWILGFSLLMALLELKVRPAIAAARQRSRDLEDRADRELAISPTESVMLLRSALAHAVDATREQALAAKIIEVDARLTAGVLATSQPPVPLEPAAETMAGASGPRRVGTDGRYVLEKILGRGGMGVVWRARDGVLDRVVAMKELPDTADPELRERFKQEARALARLSHPHVVQVFDFVEHEARMYIAMELVEGGDLDAAMKSATPPARDRALEIARQIASGLAFAHKKGIAHRDVKPLNILLAPDGAAKVTDFGLAKLSEATMHTREGAVIGSPRYMSPEQAAGAPAGPPADVYSFGAVLFHLLTGRPPFDGDVASVLAQHITQPPPPLASPSPAIDALVARCLAKDPAQRPPMDDVERTLAGESGTSPKVVTH